jgi:clan AA aspartic protease (TIGR02281 family)
MIQVPRWCVLGLSVLCSIFLSPAGLAGGSVPVAEELERLSAEHGFTVVGLEATEEAVGRADSDVLYPRLRRLLESFDHVIVQGADGHVERVIILGEKVPFVPTPAAETPDGSETASDRGEAPPEDEGEILLPTKRDGSQHSVTASLEGAGGKRVELVLLVDTGADFVVLPSTMVGTLGLPPGELKQAEMQTANGKVAARLGTLPGLWLGGQRISDIQVAFIEDGKLGGGGLLGMSVLGRYTMTIDDEKGSLTLTKK